MHNKKHSLTPVIAHGFRAHLGTIHNYIDFTTNAISRRERYYIFDLNLHSLYFYYQALSFRKLYKNAITKIDGMPIVWLLRIGGINAHSSHRVTWVDFVWPLLAHAQRCGWRVFWLGGDALTQSLGLAQIRSRLPKLNVAGNIGYFDTTPEGKENQRIISSINEYRTDLCIVGMGTPRQEQWITQNREAINAPVMYCAGACLEYVAGVVRTPPRWMGRCGLEWSFRLLENPRRFSRRYCIEPWALLWLLANRALRPNQYSLDRGFAIPVSKSNTQAH